MASVIIDYPKIRAIVADEYLKQSIIAMTNACERQPLSNEGSYEYSLRERIFQDVSGQVVAPLAPISSQERTQLEVKHPKLWRSGSYVEPSYDKEIDNKTAQRINTDIGMQMAKSAAKFWDDSAVATIEGVGAAITGNQYDSSGAVLTLDAFVTGMSKLGERGLDLNGGILAGNSSVYFKLLGLGMVAQTSNQFGNANQERMVILGQLPNNLLGLSFAMSDKFLVTAVANKYYCYMIGAGAINAYGGEVPKIEVSPLTALGIFGQKIIYEIMFGLGFKGTTYGGTFNKLITDTDLATAANWTLAAPAANQVKLARVLVAVA